MDTLDHSPTFDGADLGLGTDDAAPVSWRSAVTIWIVLSVAGWAGMIGLVAVIL